MEGSMCTQNTDQATEGAQRSHYIIWQRMVKRELGVESLGDRQEVRQGRPIDRYLRKCCIILFLGRCEISAHPRQ